MSAPAPAMAVNPPIIDGLRAVVPCMCNVVCRKPHSGFVIRGG
jgi:hypothetical protein